MHESIKETVKLFLDRGYLINPELIEGTKLDIDFLDLNLEKNNTGELLIFNENMLNELIENKDKHNFIDSGSDSPTLVKIVKSYDKSPKKVSVQDFVMHYQRRYELIKKILQSRSELSSPLSISRLLLKKDREKISTIGLVYEKNQTKNGNIVLTLEDNTGSISVLISKQKKELFDKTKEIVLDEVLGVTGVSGDKIIFANDIFFPDVPKNFRLKTGPDEVYFAVISDLHLGSNYFLKEEFLKFIGWLNGEEGSKEQKELAVKVKYLFIVGDLVDNVGVYPGQEKDQNIRDIQLQYDTLGEMLKQIRKDVQIIICPGNHDAVRIAEPQPLLDKKLAKSLYDLENVKMVSNPSLVNIGSTNEFEGFDVLMYHGYSYDDYAEEVETIRHSGKTISDRVSMVMKFLLQKRHLAPTHGSTLFIPDPDTDDLVIDKVPDFFLSGHIHKPGVDQYGKTTKIASSCWQSTTPFQLKVGHNPEPGKVPVINLKTRETKILKFVD